MRHDHRVPVVMRWQRARVAGRSMAPTLCDGDVVLVQWTAAARPGDVVLARFADLPERVVVKRATRRCGDRWWVTSDNSQAGVDSRGHGPAQVVGRVIRYWPRAARGVHRLVPRRVEHPPDA